MGTKPRAAVKPTLWSHCNECSQETRHKLIKLIRKGREFNSDIYPVSVGSDWEILQCCGCDEVSMSRVDWFSEDDPDERQAPTFFPPRVSRRKPEWLTKGEAPNYQELLDEVYVALHADSRRLAMMGARAVIDMAIVKQVGDKGTFAQGLKGLQAAGLMGSLDVPLIEAAFNAGSASMHRAHNPSQESLSTVIDIVERVIHAEVLFEKVQKLQAATPIRGEKVKNESPPPF